MKIIYFTTSYPYGLGERWKFYELECFIKAFDSVTVVPFEYNGNYKPVEEIPGVKYEKPLFKTRSNHGLKQKLFSLVKSGYLFSFLKELVLSNAYTSKNKVISWIDSSYRINQLLHHSLITRLLEESDEDTLWYFFWGRQSSEMIPFLRKRVFKTACRFHRYDLYKYVNNGYLPYQIRQFKAFDLLLPCSDDGKDYIAKEAYDFSVGKIFTARLGARWKGLSSMSEDNVLRLVTCSTVEPVKRLSLIAEAIIGVSVPIIWTHIGEGSEMSKLRKQVSNTNDHVEINLLGLMHSEKVLAYYINRPVDLFINVSMSEGVPVSIMEAFSCGIPVYATDVGGTKEIVDEKVGRLIPADIDAVQLREYLIDFHNMERTRKVALRENAFVRFGEMCNADSNAALLAEKLKKLFKG